MKVRPRSFKVRNLVLKKFIKSKQKGKLAPNWKGPYGIEEVISNDAYMLENLEGIEFPRTWNMASLKFYYS